MIKKFSDYPALDSLEKYESGVLGYNNVSAATLRQAIPDIDGTPLDYEDYLSTFEPLEKADAFISFLDSAAPHKIFICGDYDTDGIMATAIFKRTFDLLGIPCDFTAPDRFVDGYGMHRREVDAALEAEADLIITVDNGIVAYDAIDYAESKGLKVIVTDHHLPQAGKNNADLIIDPWTDQQSFRDISGAQTAFKLVYALLKKHGFSNLQLYDLLSLSAITVMSDVMTVLGENRLLLKAFFAYANEQVYIQNSVINKLANLVGFYVPGNRDDSLLCIPGSFRDFNVDNINFYCVPIINSANRVIGNVNGLTKTIVDLFDPAFVDIPSTYSNMNRKRKSMKMDMLKLHQEDASTKAVVEVLSAEDQDTNYTGINGLVAAYIADQENKPALVGIDTGEDEVHFSGRSVGGFNLFEALTKILSQHPEWKDKVQFGGHAEALGMTAPKEVVPVIQEELSNLFAKCDSKMTEKTYLLLDNPHDIMDAYMNLYPYGQNFEFPQLYIKNNIMSIDIKSRTMHLFGMHGREYPIKVYDFKQLMALNDHWKTRPYDKIEAILEVAQNENGKTYFKLIHWN